MTKLSIILSIMFGAGIGAYLRYEMYAFIGRWLSLHYATLLVNIVGSFIIGILFIVFNHMNNQQLQLILVTGLLGSFTTFSTFSLDVIKMFSDGLLIQAVSYIGLQVILGVSFCYLGVKIAEYFYKFF